MRHFMMVGAAYALRLHSEGFLDSLGSGLKKTAGVAATVAGSALLPAKAAPAQTTAAPLSAEEAEQQEQDKKNQLSAADLATAQNNASEQEAGQKQPSWNLKATGWRLESTR